MFCAGVDLARRAVPAIIEEHRFLARQVFNMDEAGLNYRAAPRHSLATEQVTLDLIAQQC